MGKEIILKHWENTRKCDIQMRCLNTTLNAIENIDDERTRWGKGIVGI